LKQDNVKLYDIGYITVVDMTQRQDTTIKKQVTKFKDEEVKGSINDDYVNYFSEHAPMKKQTVHKYTVQITKAVFTDESFEVFKKYQ
jgi:hypothetical protein